MRALFYTAVALALLTVPLTRSSAGIDPDTPAPNVSNAQLVVMEANGCIYCRVFRRDVLPAYETSKQGKDMPVRFLDVNDVEASGIALKSPISMVPTFVVTKNNREVGRIPGYVSPGDFFRAISHILSSAP